MRETAAQSQNSDFSRGSVAKNILRLAVPMTVAQLIHVLYSVVDRMYLGHIPGVGADALTGVGITFPILTIITAFANLFGMGGSPLFSIERGKGDAEKAKRIMGNTFAMLLYTGLALMAVILLFKKPLLYAFGASDITFPYADGYITIYLCGSLFVMVGLGMNNFINAQGFGRKGMMTVLLGAVVNIALDPLFIFVLNLGVQGAAIATVIAQFVSALWAVSFLRGRKAVIRLERSAMRLQWRLVGRICALGFSGFIMAVTNSAVQIVCNSTLQLFGGDLYVGVMTVLNSVREVVSTPISGLTSAAQPVIGFNYGAERIPESAKGNQVYVHSLRALHYAGLVDSLRGPTALHRHFYRGSRTAGGLCARHAHLLLRLLYDVPSECWAVLCRSAGPFQAGRILLPAAQGGHRYPPHAAAAPALRPGRGRRVPGGTHFQLYRRRRLLPHHAADHLA